MSTPSDHRQRITRRHLALVPPLIPAGTALIPGASRGRLPMRVAAPLSVLGGGAMVVSGAPVGWWAMTYLSVILALWTTTGRSLGGAVVVGALFGATYYGVHLAWVQTFLGPAPWLALAGLQALLFAAGAVPFALADRWTRHWRAGGPGDLVLLPAVMAGLWVARELLLGSWPYGGFPWARVAITQVDGPLAELVSWVGSDGLSFLVVLGCAWLLRRALGGGPPRGRRGPRGRQPLRWAVLVAVLALLACAVPQYPTRQVGQLRVGWVQGDGPAGYFDPRAPGDVLRSQLRASQTVLGRPMDVLVWPEGGVDLDPLHSPRTATALDDLARAAGAPVLMNAATERKGRTYNTTMLWTGQAGPLELYDKSHPVPFGEYVPDRWLFQAMAPDLVALLQREFTPGQNAPVVHVGDVTIGLAICFDVIHDEVTRRAVRDGAQVFVFQTNNADFRDTGEGLQQLAIARMRTVESGRAVVSVSTSGPTRVFAPDGTVMAPGDEGGPDAGITTVPLETGQTLAVRLGLWPGRLVSAASLVVLAGLGARGRRRRGRV